jgi:hypothetical protein
MPFSEKCLRLVKHVYIFDPSTAGKNALVDHQKLPLHTMKNLLRALATMILLAGLQPVAFASAPGAARSTAAGVSAAAQAPGLYAVAQKFFTEGAAPVADISVASEKEFQLVTVTASAGNCRAVLTDADGQILRTRNVEGEIEFDFYSLPNGTYRLAILDGSGTLHLQQTLVKR